MYMKNLKKNKKSNNVKRDRSNLVLGLFQPDSTMGKLASIAQDGKTHRIDQFKKVARGRDLMGRLFNLERKVRIAGIGKVERDLEAGTIRMSVKKGVHTVRPNKAKAA